MSAGLFLCLSIIRSGILPVEWEIGYSLVTYIPRMILAAYYDFCFVGSLAVFFISINALAKRNKLIAHLVRFLFQVTVLLTLIIALINQQIIQIIGSPFSYQWYYYSDFMGSLDAQNAMLANVSWELFLEIAVMTIALIVFFLMFSAGVHFYRKHYTTPSAIKLYVLTGVVFVCYSFSFAWYTNYKSWQYTRLANPFVFFIQSSLYSHQTIPLFSMNVSRGFEDEPAANTSIQNISLQEKKPNSPQITNVLIFVLESVPAEYVDIYGSRYGITPEITKLIPESILFNNIYAHSPATNNSMVSILGSVYPWLSFKSLTKEHPEVKLPTLSTVMKQKNYRTAFFNAGDLQFQRANEFLSPHFDTIEDFNSKHCRNKQFIVQGERWENPDGADDECMVDAFAEWMDAEQDRPFFATLWTVQTHYPYFYFGPEKDYQVNNTDMNRYLNALHHSDQTLGKLINLLKQRGLDESTLVVIVGDHGEAFGRHKQYTHASNVYEENVHVPLILVNKKLFHGEINNQVGGHIDIAPTITDILNFPVEAQWQGQSLFNEQRKNRTYFFAPWSDFLFGYRENNMKYIYNATRNTTEIYNLVKDSTETTNLVHQFAAEDVAKAHERLAGWIQYHTAFMKTVIEK